LWAQRHSWVLPRPVRSAGRRLLERIRPVSDEQHLVEDWSVPLFPHRRSPLPRSEAPTFSGALPTSANPPSPTLRAGDETRREPTNRFHCLIVTPVLDTGGLDEFVAFLARQLPTFGVKITIMHDRSLSDQHRTPGRLASILRSEGIAVIDAMPDEGRQWLLEHQPDVISAHDPSDWVLDAAHACRIPVVETLHGIPTPISTDWRKEVLRGQKITSFVAVSELVRRQYLRGNRHFPREAVITIPNAFNDTHRPAVDRAQARAWLGLENEFLFVTLARHVLQKNAYGLVSAFADVARSFPEAHLLIAGRMDDRAYTQQVVRLRDGLPERHQIHLRDNISNPSVLLAAADAFVMDSFFEGWSLASMEALCAGLPVVSSEVGGAREQLGPDGERGYVVPNPLGDPETVSWESAGRERFRPQANRTAFAAAMTSLVTNRDRWAKTRPILAEESKRRFSARTCAKQHANALRAAVARHCSKVSDH